jgi:hypothetical protein
LPARRRRGRRPGPSSFRFVPPHLLDGQPHVIVDGAPRVGSVYTLSHWPDTPTPVGLRADLSAEIARSAIARPELLPSEVDLVSIDHYDVDGVVALALLVHDGLDDEFGPLLVEAARVGDFDVVTDRGAALIAFTLNGLDAASPDPLERCGALAQDALSMIADLAADPYRFESLWHDEWEAYDSSVRALDEGWATIEEIPETDLAIVRVDTGQVGAAAAAWASAPLHPAAVHSATSCLRTVTLAGRWMEFHYRYESWVRLASRRPRPRVDLDRLAHDLTAAETASGRWVFDGAGSITGALHLVGGHQTTIEPDRFLDSVCAQLEALDNGPSAWNPYDSR